MSESAAASPANLDDERDELKFELIVLKGHLKDKFDFSSMIDPLLDATAPATIEINAKMKKLVARLQAQVETLNITDRNNQLLLRQPLLRQRGLGGWLWRQRFLLLVHVTVLLRKTVNVQNVLG